MTISRKSLCYIKYYVAIAITAMLCACGGGSDSTPTSQPEPVPDPAPGPVIPPPLKAGSFTKSIMGSGVGLSTLIDAGAGRRYMFLLQASDIKGSGDITSIDLQLGADNVADISCPNTTIRMGHSSAVNLDVTFDNNVGSAQGKGSFVTVVDNATIIIPIATSGDFISIPLSKTFHYNGVDNLVFEVARPSGCTSGALVQAANSAGYTATVHSNTAADAIKADFNDTNRISANLVFGGGDNYVTALDNTGAFGAQVAPGYQGHSQFMIMADDMEGSGPITGIEFGLNLTVITPLTGTYTVRMAHIDPTAMDIPTANFADNLGTSSALVADAISVTVPAGANEFWLPLTGSFQYDGTSNLLIDIVASSVPNPVPIKAPNTSHFRNVSNTDLTAATGGRSKRTVEPKLRFYGSTIDRVAGIGAYEATSFTNNPAGGVSQVMYHASELGTSGTITRIACRMVNLKSFETAYSNFEVIMSHTDKTELDKELALNLPASQVVYSGTLTVPANLLQGDWIEIPLTTGFGYNGVQNLVIQTKTAAGSSVHTCGVYEDATRYPGRLATGTSRDATIATQLPQQRDLRLWISK